ncbi:hypothetical protein ACE6H2_027444 [Prunus campanulata]
MSKVLILLYNIYLSLQCKRLSLQWEDCLLAFGREIYEAKNIAQVERGLSLVSANDPTLSFSCMLQNEMNDTLTLAMKASFDRMDALLAQILERVKAFDFKISLALKQHSMFLAILAPCDAVLDDLMPIFQGCHHVLESCDSGSLSETAKLAAILFVGFLLLMLIQCIWRFPQPYLFNR